MDKVKIAIQIREDVEFGIGDIRQYNDTLYYTEAEYAALKEGDVEKEKQRRITNWVNHVKDASTRVPAEPTKEEYEAMLAQQEEQVEELKSKMVSKGYLSVDEPLTKEK
jgi:hypothetical protein